MCSSGAVVTATVTPYCKAKMKPNVPAALATPESSRKPPRLHPTVKGSRKRPRTAQTMVTATSPATMLMADPTMAAGIWATPLPPEHPARCKTNGTQQRHGDSHQEDGVYRGPAAEHDYRRLPFPG